MAESNSAGQGLPNLEFKIENMIDELIKTDEEIEKNGPSSTKFIEDISLSEDDKTDKELFEKDFFFNHNLQIDEQSNKINNLSNQNIESTTFQNNVNNVNNSKINHISNQFYNNSNMYLNYSPFIFNNVFNLPISNQNNYNNSPVLGLGNNNIIYNNNTNKILSNNSINLKNNSNNSNTNIMNNNINQKSSETLNSTNSFSINYDKNYKSLDNNLLDLNNSANYTFLDNNVNSKDINNKNSLMNYRGSNFNSFCNEDKKYIFKRSSKFHNSYYAGDKLCCNKKLINSKNNNINNIFNSNEELEILLIEVNKIVSKIEKIDQFCYNKLKGKFEEIIRTHKGSRIFQNYLKNTHCDILHQIFLEIKNKLPDLIRDSYANYFCKKFYDSLNQKDRIEYLISIQNQLSSLAIDPIATYPIQGIIEKLGSKNEKRIIYLGIKDSIDTFCYNVYGTHIIEKILSYFEDEFTKEIIDFVYNNFMYLACHINGVCIAKKLLLMTHKRELHQKIKKIIIQNSDNLIIHQYGNYVIQTIVENWEDNDIKEIIDLYKNRYVYLSQQKYSSNVIERIIEKNEQNLEFYINEILISNNLYEVMKNIYGNYVIQKALKLSSDKTKEKLIKNIMKNIHKLEDNKIMNKWKMIISSSSSK